MSRGIAFPEHPCRHCGTLTHNSIYCGPCWHLEKEWQWEQQVRWKQFEMMDFLKGYRRPIAYLRVDYS